MKNKEYVENLLRWHRKHRRNLPFRETTDPYFIWLSEVIFQQTRIRQGLPYYRNFIETFPTIFALAEAELEEVFRVWQGLGYYRRAENLHKTAKIVVEKYRGKFPCEYEDLCRLPGVGDYIASAILAFAFNKPVIALDGNIRRTLLRKNAISDEMYASSATKKLKTLGKELLRYSDGKELNEALMDLGASVCLPKPLCKECPVQKQCQTFEKNLQTQIPVKKKKRKPPEREMHFLLLQKNGKIALQKRTADDIWRNLYTFPELSEAPKEGILLRQTEHHLTHFRLKLFLWKIKEGASSRLENEKNFLWIFPEELKEISLPTGIRKLGIYI